MSDIGRGCVKTRIQPASIYAIGGSAQAKALGQTLGVWALVTSGLVKLVGAYVSMIGLCSMGTHSQNGDSGGT